MQVYAIGEKVMVSLPMRVGDHRIKYREIPATVAYETKKGVKVRTNSAELRFVAFDHVRPMEIAE